MGHGRSQAAPAALSQLPWRVDPEPQDIRRFSHALPEHLARTCPAARGQGPAFGAPLLACHQFRPGPEVHCADWLASLGHAHPGVRLAVTRGRLEPTHLKPGSGRPALDDSYADVLGKLRRSAAALTLEGPPAD